MIADLVLDHGSGDAIAWNKVRVWGRHDPVLITVQEQRS